jgi:hypothetical protein
MPLYTAFVEIPDKEGNIEIKKIRRVVMEYNHVFNPIQNEQEPNTNPSEPSFTGGHEIIAEENNESRPSEEVRGVQE